MSIKWFMACAAAVAPYLLWTQVALAQTVEVFFFGNNQYQPTHIEAARALGASVTIYNLDAQVNLEKQLAEGLPAHDIAKATAMAQQRIAQIPQQDMVNLFTGVLRAREWGIERFPAVVFGPGRAVVYGLTDLEQAVLLWRDHASTGGLAP